MRELISEAVRPGRSEKPLGELDRSGGSTQKVDRPSKAGRQDERDRAGGVSQDNSKDHISQTP